MSSPPDALPGYLALVGVDLRDGDVELVSLRQEDLTSLMHWRNAQMDILRQDAPLTLADQENFWHSQVVPTFTAKEPGQVLLSVLRDGVCMGYGGLVHVDWMAARAEISFLLDPEIVAERAEYQRIFRVFLELLPRVAFGALGLKKIFTECYDLRPWHVEVIEQAGFALEGRLREHVFTGGQRVDAVFHGLLADEWAAR